MNSRDESTRTTSGRTRRSRRVSVAAASASLMLLAAACGSSSSSGKASAAGSASTSSASSSSPTTAQAAADLGLITAGTIQAATQNDEYPFAFIGSDGQLQGFSIDLVDAIAKAIGVKVNYKSLTLDPILSGLEARQYDIAAIGLAETAARQKVLGFSEPYYYGYFGILARKNAPVDGTAGLAGKTVAVVTGSAQIAYAQQHYPSAELKEFPNQPAALAALVGGQVDAFFLGGPDTVKYLKQNPSLELAATVQLTSPNAFPTPPGDTALINAINKQLDAMFADGTYAQLYKKWFTQPIPSELIQAHPNMKTS